MTRAAVCLVLVLACPVVAQERVTLTGTVNDDQRRPLAGATVVVRTAGPRYGYNPLCPSCYADCGKRAVTDSEGNYRIEGLDPDLVFGLLAFAPGHRPKIRGRTDPTDGAAHLFLDKLSIEGLGPQQIIQGRVLAHDGKPVAGASVSPFGMKADDRRFWGDTSRYGVDALAATDEQGRFIITSTTPFLGLDLQVSAPGLLTRNFLLVPSGRADDFRLDAGATLTGRVLRDGKPLEGVTVGAVQADRSVGLWVGERAGVTDADGRFTISNLPADEELLVYSKMGSLNADGAIPPQKVQSGATDSVTEIDDLAVGPAHKIAGRVALSDGKPVPQDTSIVVSVEGAWDFVTVELEPDGRFEVTGVPPGRVSISARVSGYRLSPKNASLDTLNDFRLQGTIEADVTDLLVLFDPAPASEGVVDGLAIGGELERVRARMRQRREHSGYAVGADQPIQGAERASTIKAREEYALRGRLLLHDGSPAAGADVWLVVYSVKERTRDLVMMSQMASHMAKSGQLALQPQVLEIAPVLTDALGAFEITHIPAGYAADLLYWGEGVPEGRMNEIEDLSTKGRADLTLRAQQGGRIVGRVNRTSYPDVESIGIRSQNGAGFWSDQKVGRDEDRFEFKDLAPGQYVLTAHGSWEESSGENRPNFQRQDFGTYKVSVVAGQTKEVEVGHGQTYELSGRAMDRGQPMPGRQLALYSRELNVQRTTTTDDDGRFKFDRVQPAGYRLIPLGEQEPAAMFVQLEVLNPKRFAEVEVVSSNIDRDFEFLAKTAPTGARALGYSLGPAIVMAATFSCVAMIVLLSRMRRTVPR